MRNFCDFESHVYFIDEVYLQITRSEITQSSCKQDTKSKSHPGMKLAPVRVFSCKHPLTYHQGDGYTLTDSAYPNLTKKRDGSQYCLQWRRGRWNIFSQNAIRKTHPDANCVLPTNLTVPVFWPATITLSPVCKKN